MYECGRARTSAGMKFTHTLRNNNRAGQEDLNRAPERERETKQLREKRKLCFLDLVHIGLLLELNSELYSNLEEKEVVRRSGASVMNI